MISNESGQRNTDEQAADVAELEEQPEIEIEEESASPEITPEESGKLARLDPFRKYLLDIRKFEVLDPDEERELALHYRKSGDPKAAYQLITSNLKLVVKIAMMYRRIYANAMDLIQEGNIGLMEAVKRFDPYKGARLPTYAAWWIKAYIIKFIIDNFRIVRIGTTNERRKLLFNLKKEKEKLRMQGIEPTAQLIADKLNVSVEDVKAVQHNIESQDLSLDSYVGEGDSIQYVDTLRATEEQIDERLARGELQTLFNQKIEEFATQLSEREKVILRERLLAEEPKTLQEIADRFGVTREAIRLNEKSLTSKIRDYMQDAFKGVTEVEIGMLD